MHRLKLFVSLSLVPGSTFTWTSLPKGYPVTNRTKQNNNLYWCFQTGKKEVLIWFNWLKIRRIK